MSTPQKRNRNTVADVPRRSSPRLAVSPSPQGPPMNVPRRSSPRLVVSPSPQGPPMNVPRRLRTTKRKPIPLERLAQRPWKYILNNNINRVPATNDVTFVKNSALYMKSAGKRVVTDNDLIHFIRLVDTMHDITERDKLVSDLSKNFNFLIKPTTLTENIRVIYGDDYAKFYKSFAEVVMRLESREYNNIKVVKSRLYNYITKISVSKFNDGRRVEFQYNSPVSNNRLSNITPILLDKLMSTMNQSRFVVDATKYSLNTDMRLESVKRSKKQLLTFSQLIDPSTISTAFDRYLFEIQETGHFSLEKYMFAFIHSFTDMHERFDYFYVMKNDLFQSLRRNGNVLFLKQYVKEFALVCFRTPLANTKHDPFLNAYLLNADFFKERNQNHQHHTSEMFEDHLMYMAFREFNKLHNQADLPNGIPFNLYKTPTFTKDKLSIEKLVRLSGTDNTRLKIALDYKRSFDSVQMHYQAYLNKTADFIQFAGKSVSDEHRTLWNLFHNSTIISFDILSGLFGYLYGANVMIEYRGTYRMFSVDQSSTMQRVAIKKARRVAMIEKLRKEIYSVNHMENTLNQNVRTLNNDEKKVLQNAKRLVREGTNLNDDSLNLKIQTMTNQVREMWESRFNQ